MSRWREINFAIRPTHVRLKRQKKRAMTASDMTTRRWASLLFACTLRPEASPAETCIDIA
ncbi:hypothetical protein DAI22_03g210050 [Oryza sativa Japonica Group]|nr:hypothetical protein DAI22_03g210050 [Oryza sativa Japonica Group]